MVEDTLFRRMSSDEVIFSLKIRHCLLLDIRDELCQVDFKEQKYSVMMSILVFK